MDGVCFNCGCHLPAGSAVCAMCGALGNAQALPSPEAGRSPETAVPGSVDGGADSRSGALTIAGRGLG